MTARTLSLGALALLAMLLVLELLGGREATEVLTGALSPSAPLGLAYVAAWLLTVALAPVLLLAAGFELFASALGRLFKKNAPR